MAKILIVEDDPSICAMVQDALLHLNFEVEVINRGDEALGRLQVFGFDLVILDWNLPGLTGYEILQQLRLKGNVIPILMLTAKSDPVDKETGLDGGADDYLTKPFNTRELGARVRALLRRTSGSADNRLRAGSLTLDPVTFQCLLSGQEVRLTRREFSLLEFLMRHQRQVFTAEDLLDHVWKSETDAYVDAVRSTVTRLRKKLELPDGSTIIHNMYGLGYKLEVP